MLIEEKYWIEITIRRIIKKNKLPMLERIHFLSQAVTRLPMQTKTESGSPPRMYFTFISDPRLQLPPGGIPPAFFPFEIWICFRREEVPLRLFNYHKALRLSVPSVIILFLFSNKSFHDYFTSHKYNSLYQILSTYIYMLSLTDALFPVIV